MMSRSYYENEKAIRKIFEEESDLEIMVKNLVRRITNTSISSEPPQTRYNSICSTIRRLSSGDNAYLETKKFPSRLRRYGPFGITPTTIKMVRRKKDKYEYWKIEYTNDTFSSYFSI